MTLASRVSALATRLATEFNTVRGELSAGLAGKANTSHTHAAGDVNSGTFGIARIPTGSTSTTVATGNHNHDTAYAAASHTHAATDVASGTLNIARVPTGTSGTTVALGNHTHAAYQAADSDLDDIAALTHANDTVLQTKSGTWSARTPTQLEADLAAVRSGGLGVVARGRRTTSSTTTTATSAGTAQKVLEVSATLKTGRLYRITAPNVGYHRTTAGRVGMQLTYTTNGTTPGVTSTQLNWTQSQTYDTGDPVYGLTLGATYTPGANQTMRVLLSVWSVTTGTSGTYADAAWPTEIVVEDLGVDPGSSGTSF